MYTPGCIVFPLLPYTLQLRNLPPQSKHLAQYTMSGVRSRLAGLLGHFTSESGPARFEHRFNHHSLSPTFFLPRAAAVEPSVSRKIKQSETIPVSSEQPPNETQAEAIYHVTANNKILRRTYIETADRARGLAYFIKKHGYKRVGILCPNTPAFLESIFGIAAAGAVNVGKESVAHEKEN